MRASICALVIFALAATPVAAADEPAPDPVVVAAEREKKQAEAETAKLQAEIAKLEKQKALAEAQWGFLPKSPAANGKTTIDSNGAALETDLLVADALASAAVKIANDMPVSNARILILGGSEGGGNGRLITFLAEAYGLKNTSQRMLGSADLCLPKVVPQPGKGVIGPQSIPLPAIGALASGLSDMLKTDTTISGKTSELGEAQLVRAVVAAKPAAFRTAYFDARNLNPNNAVMVELGCLGTYRDAITGALASFVTDEQKKENAAKIARLTAQAAAHDELMGRLTKADKDNAPLLASLYADAEIAKSTSWVLRVWTDAKGGTLINRHNLWTNFGARAVSMTGGAVISYLLVNLSGDVERAGLLRCNTELVSLRRVHRIGKTIGQCEALTKPGG